MNNRKIRYSGHQTFCFRYGWLEKGYAFLKEERNFTDEDSIVALGVGKNMVASIQYWCEIADIAQEGVISSFAEDLLSESDGWDPYLEDIASWWLLHWKIATNPHFHTAGRTMFSCLRKPEFSKYDVAEASLRLVEEGKKAPSESSIMRDVDCYIRAYAGAKNLSKSKRGEESFECPLHNLNLVQPMIDGGMYRFSIGHKASLPPEIIGYAIAEFFGQSKQSTMTIQSVLYKEDSPGQVFMLDENALIEAVEALHDCDRWCDYFNFSESAGIAQIHCTLDALENKHLLNAYFNQEA